MKKLRNAARCTTALRTTRTWLPTHVRQARHPAERAATLISSPVAPLPRTQYSLAFGLHSLLSILLPCSIHSSVGQLSMLESAFSIEQLRESVIAVPPLARDAS